MKGVVITNGYYESECSVHQAERTLQELRALGADVTIEKNDEAYIIKDESSSKQGGFSLKNGEKPFDFAVFYDKDINLARHLENMGVRVFNRSQAIEDADDKIRTAEILAHNDIPVPATIPAPKKYYGSSDREFLKKAASLLGFPMIFKLSRGSLGREVFLVNGFDELIALDEKYATVDRLYQEFCAESYGQSYRAIVIGGKYICAMHLTNKTDFRSNAAQGGSAEKVDLPAEYREIAEKAALVMGCDYCGVDLFVHKPMVIELNSNAYFMSMEKTTGVNVALNYAKYITERGI